MTKTEIKYKYGIFGISDWNYFHVKIQMDDGGRWHLFDITDEGLWHIGDLPHHPFHVNNEGKLIVERECDDV